MQKFELPKMPYDFSALEPIISGEIMDLHYNKHHQTYVTNLNVALEKYDEAVSKKDIGVQISLQGAIRFNGGGHINHSLFWESLCPISQSKPLEKGLLFDALIKDFGSVHIFIEKLSATSTAIQGSGWGWLGYDKVLKRLVITTCCNQDPLSLLGYIPIFGIDVWEHAYYLQYKNVRAKYVENIWKVVNWTLLEKRYEQAVK